MADPNYEFIEGFDKYGENGTDWTYHGTSLESVLVSFGEWSSVVGTSLQISAPRGGSHGRSLQVAGTQTGTAQGPIKTLPGNFARAIGTVYVERLTSAQFISGVTFFDGATAQLTIGLNSEGKLQVRRGAAIGTATVIFTGTEVYPHGTPLCIQFDVTIHGTAGIVKLWANGVATSVNLSAIDTNMTANAYFNAVGLQNEGNTAGDAYFDHFWIGCYTAAGGTELPPLTNAQVATDQVASVDSAQFTPVVALLGRSESLYSAADTYSIVDNRVTLSRYVSRASGDLTSIQCRMAKSSGSVSIRYAVYADNAGTIGALLGETAVQAGFSPGWNSIDLITPVPVVAGSAYWLSVHGDATLSDTFYYQDDNTPAQYGTITFGASAPANPIGGSNGSLGFTIQMFGLIRNVADNSQITKYGFPTNVNYVQSNTVGHEDTYNVPNLPVAATAIHAVAIKANAWLANAGARTINLRMKSGATFGNGSLGTAAPPLSPTFVSSYFRKNPDGNVDWTPTTLQAAKIGYRIAA